MLSISSLGAVDPMLGLLPTLREGFDYRMTSQGAAIAMNAGVLVLFRSIQDATNRAANLFGMPGAIAIDGKIGPVTGSAIKFTIGKFTDDLRGSVSAGARDGQTNEVAKDARNVLGTLLEAIERKSSAPIVATPIAPTIKPPPFVLPVVVVQASGPTPPAVTAQPLIPAVPFVPTARPGLSTAALAGIGGAILLFGIGAAVLASRK